MTKFAAVFYIIVSVLGMTAQAYTANPVSVSMQSNAIIGQVDPASEVRIAVIPNDTDFGRQDYLVRVHAPSAWDYIVRYEQKSEVVVAVLDTGVDIQHPEIAGSVWRNIDEVPNDGIDNDRNSYIDDVHGWDFMDSSNDPKPKYIEGFSYEAIHHGTVVAGIIAAAVNNAAGIAGASYGARIMPLRILDSTGAGNTLLLTQAIQYAVDNGADIINLSLVGDVRDPRLEGAIEAAYDAGVAVVAASGNQEVHGVDLNVNARYPVCDHDGVNRVLGVAAVDSENRLTSFSNYGSNCIDLSAPGTSFYSTVWHIDGNPQFTNYFTGGWSGTSVAAPLVSSALALIRRVAPNLSVSESYRIIIDSVDSLEPFNINYEALGAGLLNMERAVSSAVGVTRERPIRVVIGQGPNQQPKVSVRDMKGEFITEFLAYAQAFKGGVSTSVGDVDGDGNAEIVTAPYSAGGPHIRVFDMQGKLKSQFMALPPSFRGGLSVATGDVNGDGIDEIVTAVRSGAGPEVRVFSYRGELISRFFAYQQRFRGGVSIAVGDTDKDRVSEIITAPASRGGPHVRIFDGTGKVKGEFMAYDTTVRDGYSIGVGDVDGVRGAEIVVSRLSSSNVQIRVFEGNREKNRFLVFPEAGLKEFAVQVVVDDYTGDSRDDILVFPATSGSRLKLFDYYGRLIDEVTLVDAPAPAPSYTFSVFR